MDWYLVLLVYFTTLAPDSSESAVLLVLDSGIVVWDFLASIEHASELQLLQLFVGKSMDLNKISAFASQWTTKTLASPLMLIALLRLKPVLDALATKGSLAFLALSCLLDYVEAYFADEVILQGLWVWMHLLACEDQALIWLLWRIILDLLLQQRRWGGSVAVEVLLQSLAPKDLGGLSLDLLIWIHKNELKYSL